MGSKPLASAGSDLGPGSPAPAPKAAISLSEQFLICKWGCKQFQASAKMPRVSGFPESPAPRLVAVPLLLVRRTSRSRSPHVPCAGMSVCGMR